MRCPMCGSKECCGGGQAAEEPVEPWPIKGVRVDGDTVIISVTGGNDSARWLCGELVKIPDSRRREACE